MKTKLTKTVIAELQPNPAGTRVLLDTETKGFGVRVTPNGAKSYVFQWGVGARRKRVTIAPVEKEGTTVEKARKIAAGYRLVVTAGGDPRAEIVKAKAEATVAELAKRFLAEYASKKQPSTERLYRRLVERHLLPHLGARSVSSLRWEDFAALQDNLREHPVTANRALALCSKIWEWGMQMGLVSREGRNPARDHDRLRERRRGQALDAKHLARLGKALDAEGPAFPALCIRFILLTGCRPGEAYKATWQDVDLGRRRWTLSKAKTGARVVFLGKPAADLLRKLPRLDRSPLLFPSRTGGPMVDIKSTWRRVSAAAELPPDVRVYDATRHTFATWAGELGVPRDVRKVLTGHAPGGEAHDLYLHLSAEPLRQADRVAAALARALRGEGVKTSGAPRPEGKRGDPREPAAGTRGALGVCRPPAGTPTRGARGRSSLESATTTARPA